MMRYIQALVICGIIIMASGLPAAAAGDTVPADIEAMALEGRWEEIYLRMDGDSLLFDLPEIRLILAHACMATNRNDQSFFLFYTITTESELSRWRDWTGRILAAHPDNPYAFYLAADSDYRRLLYRASIAKLDSALARKPDFALAYLYRAMVHLTRADYDKSLADLKKSVAQDSLLAEAYYHLGLVYHEMNRCDEAVPYYEKDIGINIYDMKGYINLASCYMETGEFDRAVAVFDRAIEVDPTYAPAYLNKARVHKQMGRLQDAIDAYRSFIDNASAEQAPLLEMARDSLRLLEQMREMAPPEG